MSQGVYPVSRFLQRIITNSGLHRSEFVESIGYRNIAKGLRRLNEWLENGCGVDDCLQRIVAAFNPDAGELETAIAQTDEIHQREHDDAIREIGERERRRFKPFIWVHTEDGAHSFFTAVAERKVKVLWFPQGFERLSETEKLETVQRRVRDHYQNTDGKYIGFGAILRYQYADTFDTSMVLDTTGEVIERNGGRSLLPEVWMALH